MSKCRVVRGPFIHVCPPTSGSDMPSHTFTNTHSRSIQFNQYKSLVSPRSLVNRTLGPVPSRCSIAATTYPRDASSPQTADCPTSTTVTKVKHNTHIHQPRTTRTVAKQDDPPLRRARWYFQWGIPEAGKRRPPGDDSYDGICGMRNQFRRPVESEAKYR